MHIHMHIYIYTHRRPRMRQDAYIYPPKSMIKASSSNQAYGIVNNWCIWAIHICYEYQY